MQLHVDDLAFRALHAERLGETAQIARVEAGVEMEGMEDVGERRVRDVGATQELAGARRHAVEDVVAEFRGFAAQVQLVPVMMEGHQAQVAPAHRAEGVVVAMAGSQPIDEFDAELEGALGLADEIVFVEAERAVEQADLRDGGLAHADDADLVGFDQADRYAAPEQLGQRRAGHPARGATAHDHDAAQAQVVHVSQFPVTKTTAVRGGIVSVPVSAAKRAWPMIRRSTALLSRCTGCST